MKTIILKKSMAALLLPVMIIFSACDLSLTGIKGKGEIVKQEILLSDFKKINMAIDADVTIIRGDKQFVEISGQQNIIDNIERDVYSGEWSIKYDKNVRTHDPISITIILTDLEAVYLSGSGNIISDDAFEENEFEVIISGSGNIELFLLSNKIDATISGSGSINLIGNSDEQAVTISGSGDYNGFGLESNICDIDIPGSGNCEVFANDNLFVKISGSGNVYYKGTPSVNSVITGSGKVKKVF